MATQHELINAKVKEDLALGRVNPEEWTPEYLNKKGFRRLYRLWRVRASLPDGY
jgi:hypothetical protein